MMYQYNYGFLKQWLDENKKIQKKAVLKALGIKSNNGLKAWTDGKGPMPVLNILRFCNSFQVPIARFFRDLDTNTVCNFQPEHPDVNDQLEPFGGYDNEQQTVGHRNFEDPTRVEIQHSRLPKESQAESVTNPKGAHAPSAAVLGSTTPTPGAPAPSPSQPSSAAPSPTPTLDANALLALETTHAAQRDRLLDIIADQQRTIADLTTQLAQLSQSPTPTYHVVKEYAPSTDTLGMVAEPDPEA